MTDGNVVKNWSELVLNADHTYRIKIFKASEGKGFDLLIINDNTDTYEIIDRDLRRKELIEAREVCGSMLSEKFPNVTVIIDKSKP